MVKLGKIKSLKSYLSVLMFLAILVFGSCAPTEIDDLNPIDKFIGTWNVSDQAVRLNYQVTISANSLNSSEVLLSNFADLSQTAVGLVVGNSIVIDNQPMGDNYTVDGYGRFDSDTKLTFSYQLNDGIDIESRSAIFIK